MTLREIHDNVMKAPTMMEPEEELRFMDQLMKLPFETIQSAKETFSSVMDRLYESHMQAVFDVDEPMLPSFFAFSDWLGELASAANSSAERKGLENLAEHFRIDPRQIKF